MFRDLPVYSQEEETLVALGTSMIQDAEPDKPLGEPDEDENTTELDGALRLPAGYTYFGQFVDHDITFDPVSSLIRQNDPDALTDFRTPRFDLDSLYGRGPADQPYMYSDGVHLALGRALADDPAIAGPDLPRAENGRAIIGDPRNDENLIVSQLQVAFIRFHNAVVDQVAQQQPGLQKDDIFKRAQQTVRWHYQWVVVNDYLRRLVGQEVLDDILVSTPYATPGGEQVAIPDVRLRFYSWRKRPYMPVEFSVAAYRFGHSIARPSYLINDVARTDPPLEGAQRIPLFSQSDQPKQSLNGFRPLPDDWGVDWKLFLAGIHGQAAANVPQPSYKLDAQLSHPLGELPRATAEPEVLVGGEPASIAQILAVRNLLRGLRMGLPSGQDVARAMGIAPLSDDELLGELQLEDAARLDLEGHAPLWFYILKEAEKRGESGHLGPVGGRIVAEVLIGLLAGDPLSYLNVQPAWTPSLPAATPPRFTLSDIINFAIPPPEHPGPPPYRP
jgi:Animal haem peroxidase